MTKYNFNIAMYAKLQDLYKAIKKLDIDEFNRINTEISDAMQAQIASGDTYCTYDEV